MSTHKHCDHATFEALEPRLLLSTTILSEGFEGVFPGAWSVNTSQGRNWDDTSRRAYTGGWSAHCGDGAPTNNYLNNMSNYMQRTVNLSSYDTATLSFRYWMNTEINYDYFRIRVNGTSMWSRSGSYAIWNPQSLNLDSYAGLSSVTVRFEFTSDGSVVPSGDSGVWVDDVLLVADTTTDSNDQISEATTVLVGSNVTGNIDPDTDVDMYRVNVSAGQRLGFDIDTSSNGNLDSYLRLFDSSGTELTSNDDATGPSPEPNDLDSYIVHTFASAGAYYIGVSSFGNEGYDPVTGDGDSSGGGTGSWTLYVTEAGPYVDSNDQISEVSSSWIVLVGEMTGGMISDSMDVDMVRVDVLARQTIGFDIDTDSSTDLDSYLRLFDSRGRELASNDDATGPSPEPSSLDSYIEYTFNRAGAYYIGVSDLSNTDYNPVTGDETLPEISMPEQGGFRSIDRQVRLRLEQSPVDVDPTASPGQADGAPDYSGGPAHFPSAWSRRDLLWAYYTTLLSEESGDIEKVAARAGGTVPEIKQELSDLGLRPGNAGENDSEQKKSPILEISSHQAKPGS